MRHPLITLRVYNFALYSRASIEAQIEVAQVSWAHFKSSCYQSFA